MQTYCLIKRMLIINATIFGYLCTNLIAAISSVYTIGGITSDIIHWSIHLFISVNKFLVLHGKYVHNLPSVMSLCEVNDSSYVKLSVCLWKTLIIGVIY